MIVEFALIFPIVLLLTLGSLELGLYVFQSNAAAKATQFGARWAVVNPPISSKLQADLASTQWWVAGTLGQNCRDVGCQPSPDPTGAKYACIEGAAGCDFSGILPVMQRAFPQLTASQIRVAYQPYAQPQALGFVGYPYGVPVDVVVSINCKRAEFAFLSAFLGWAAPPAPEACPNNPPGFYLPASTTRLSSEALGQIN